MKTNLLICVYLYLSGVPSPAQQVPRVPNLPLGSQALGVEPWKEMDPSCFGTDMGSLQPCLASFVAYKSLPGAVLLVDRGDRITAHFGVGTNQKNSIFQIQSMTKPFTAAAILMLIDEKKIPSIETRVIDLPGFDKFPFPEMRIRELMTHTSGLWPVHQDGGHFRGIAPHLTNRLDHEPTVTVRDKTLAFVAGHFLDARSYPLQPKNFTYSNIGFDLLGLIIEKVSGRPFPEFVRERICRPLRMSDTFFFPMNATPEQRGRIADLDDSRTGGDDYAPYDKMRAGWNYPAPAGGLYSTAADLRQFMRLLRHKGRLPDRAPLLSPQSVDLLLRDLAPQQDCGCNSKLGHTAGFFFVRTGEPRECDELPGLGTGSVYHGGRFLTFFWFEPRRDEIGIYLVQRLTRRDFATTVSFLGESQAMLQMLARIR